MADYPVHEIEQRIKAIELACLPDFEVGFEVGKLGVTRIEATAKPGDNAYIPYIRVWKGDDCLAEFNQHNLIGVYFFPVEPMETTS